MSRQLVITILLFIFFAACSKESKVWYQKITQTENQTFSYPASKEEAFSLLMSTNEFATAYVGYAAEASPQVIAFNYLLDLQEADAVFKNLYDRANTTGKLYALSGFYFTDYEMFKKEYPKFVSRTDSIQTMEGCIVGDSSISSIVKRDSFYVDISPDEKLGEVGNTGNTGWLDIAHGGYPHSFKSVKNRR